MNNQPESVNEPSEPRSWREERFERRQARREALGNQPAIGTVVAGLILVLLGVVYLLQNVVNLSIPIKNWGALFILIPVLILFDRAYRFYRNAGNRLTSAVWGAGFFGIVLLVLTGVILFELNSEIWGPTIIILAGMGILAGAMIKTRDA
jgi:cation transport ATPase